ncbi:hypothetical protein EYF88_02380 [Paracoccus sediminis]|uniref:Uncharacterized protein n=1 Tax=Paracoccus sediminis TaxID=1214787 RepID=A0A238UPX1_9RHOB|nr:hypothetical protein [Paracoccus sediminis]TBN53067.1 hypothetical protein EYF88_02380 [Paracoccus sediminis]SNR23339.1 hypothetical protein SAMN06265378_101149 [Paracoccus sediminis]
MTHRRRAARRNAATAQGAAAAFTTARAISVSAGVRSPTASSVCRTCHTVFRWGLLATILSFRALKLSHSLVPAAIDPARRPRAMGIGALVEDNGLDVRMVRAFGPPG